MKNLLLTSALTAGILTSIACSGTPQRPGAPTGADRTPQEATTKPEAVKPPVTETKPQESKRPVNPDMELMRKSNELMRTGVEAIQSGDYPKALQTYQELLTIIKEDNPEIGVVYYNTACIYSLMKDKAPALDHLARAIKSGYDNREAIEADPDLLFLKEMPEFKAALDAIPAIEAVTPTAQDDADQKEALKLIEEIRGLKFKTEPEYKIMAPEMFARAYGGGSDNDSIQGFYRWADKTLYIKQGLDPVRFKGTRIHETFHALQDQLFNIGELHKAVKTTDGNYALTALIEGDATLTFIECMPESMARMMLSSATPWRMMGGEVRYDNSRRGEAAMRQGAFGYSTAALFVQSIKNAKGWAGVNAMYTNLPKSTEQVLHPEKYLANEQPVEVVVPDLGKALGAGWDSSRSDTVGEFGLLLGLLGNEKSGPLAEEAATGWAGDKFVIVENKSAGQAFAINKSVWDTAKDAREFYDASVSGMELDGEVRKDGDTATLTNDQGNINYTILKGSNVFLISNLPVEIKDKVISALK